MVAERASIDTVDRAVLAWAEGSTSAKALLAAPEERKGEGVVLQLFALAAAPLPRGEKRPPQQVLLRYRVSAWAQSVDRSHALLSDLLFAAFDHPEWEVDFTAVPAGALEPAFVLQVPLRRERPEPVAPRVRFPMRVETVEATVMAGLVLGPGEQPVSGAVVEIPSLHLTSRTTPDGTFRFARVPANALTLRVRAHGAVETFTASPAGDEVVTIRMQLKEA